MTDRAKDRLTTATIDVGTNTILLLVASFDNRGAMEVLADEQRTPRLGKGVDAARHLHEESIGRALEVLREYTSLLRKFGAGRVAVVGTSAIRDAVNREEFSALVHAETGLELEVLSGEEEALWAFRGALSGFKGLSRATVFDIGGGSTEITTGTPESVQERISIDLGSVRLHERFLKSSPPDPARIREAEEYVRKAVSGVEMDFSGSTLIAVAGTATALALLDQRIARFSREAVSGYRMTRATVARLYRRLASLSSQQIRDLSEVMHGREDIITAGAMILATMMEVFSFGEVCVSERGLRYGLALREWERENDPQ